MNVKVASPGYFQTLGVPLLAGRDFTDADREGAPWVALVNQALAHRYWPGQNPVGRRIRMPRLFGIDQDKWITIAGVVGDVRSIRLEEEPTGPTPMPGAKVGHACVVAPGMTTGAPSPIRVPPPRLDGAGSDLAGAGTERGGEPLRGDAQDQAAAAVRA